jgi:hypothetical protein
MTMARRGDGIYLRRNTWWLDFTHEGRRHFVRLGKGITRTVAREIAQVKRTKIVQGLWARDLKLPATECGACADRKLPARADRAARDVLARKKRDDGSSSTTTYFLKHPGTGLVKMGRSQNVDHRRRDLEMASGCALQVVATLAGDHEKYFHSEFATVRRLGEWFALDAATCERIERECGQRP